MAQYEGAIIADPKSKAWSFASELYDLLRAKNNHYELIEVNIQKFRDGEIKPQIKENIRRKNCFFVHDSSKDPAQWFLELNLVNYILKDSGAHEVTDVLPYLRFARQDRKDQPRVPISAKVVADCVEQYANRVLSLEIHNGAIQGFYNINFENLHSFPLAVQHFRRYHPKMLENMIVMSPDSGGAQRAEAFARKLGITEVAMGYKSREKPGEVKSLNILGDVKGKNVLIVDDMIDSGGTLIKAAKEARSQGAKKLYAYATHGLFTKGVDDLTKAFDKIFIGDTYPLKKKHKGIEIISFVPLFAEAIHRINEGISLSQLFSKVMDETTLLKKH